jgi:biopolymer transport protein TolQ
MEAETIALVQQADYSLWGLFLRATLIVKLVMFMLVLASFWAWSIIIQKTLAYRAARAEAARFEDRFWSGDPLDELFEEIGPEPEGRSERIFAAGMLEWRRSHRSDGGLIPGATARIDRSMDVAIAKESEDLQTGLAVLATVGSTTPFVGLFRHGLGYHEFVYRDCRTAKHQYCRCCAGDRRGAACHGPWPSRGNSGSDLLQQAEF